MRPGEFPVDVLDSVEDTKGNNGERGKCFIIIINTKNSPEGCHFYKDMDPCAHMLESRLYFVEIQSKYLSFYIW